MSPTDLVAMVNGGVTPNGFTFLSVATMLARESNDPMRVQLGGSISLYGVEDPSSAKEGDALPAVPEWIEVIPAPRDGAAHVETRDWRAGFSCDPQEIVDAFYAEPAERRAKPIDWEHKGHRNWESDRNPAAGWIEDLRVGEDGKSVWARVEWTDLGRVDVEYKRYRYISPVVAIQWPIDSEGNIDWDDVPKATKLVDAALTNNPATYIRDLARTPTDAADGEMENSNAGATAFAASVTSAFKPTGGRIDDKDDDMQLSKELLTHLGLPEDATGEQVEKAMLARLSKPQPATDHPADSEQRAVPEDFKEYVDAAVSPLRDENKSLRSEIEALRSKDKATESELLSTQVNGAVDSAVASFRATPAMREGLVKLGMSAGVDELRKHIDSLPSLEHLSQSAGKGHVEQEKATAELTEQEQQICDQLDIPREKFAANRNLKKGAA